MVLFYLFMHWSRIYLFEQQIGQFTMDLLYSRFTYYTADNQQACSKLSNWFPLQCLGPWMNQLPPVCCSNFRRMQEFLWTSYTSIYRGIHIVRVPFNWCASILNSSISGRYRYNIKLVVIKSNLTLYYWLHIKDRYREHFHWNCPRVNTTKHPWW